MSRINAEYYTKINKEEADKLEQQGVAVLFDIKPTGREKQVYTDYYGFGGFFEAKDNGRKDLILIITEEGYYTRPREDLVKSKDEIFVGFIEQGTPPRV